MNEGGVEEIPPLVRGARKRLWGNDDLKAVIQWAASIHGVGEHDFEEDPRKDDYQNGQRRSITFLAQALGVPLNILDNEPILNDEDEHTTKE